MSPTPPRAQVGELTEDEADVLGQELALLADGVVEPTKLASSSSAAAEELAPAESEKPAQ
jgi:hypothetical protein